MRPGGPAFFGYSTNYLVDVRAGVIVDVEATSAHRTREVDATRTMIERVEQRFALKPAHLIGDMAYGAAPMLGWLVQDKQIAPHIPVWDRSERSDGTFSHSDFTFDAEHNHYVCPAGKLLNPAAPNKDPFTIAPASSTACLRAEAAVLSECSGARSIAVRTSRRATWHAHWPRRRLIASHVRIARRWRCCSRTSSAFCRWIGCDCADRRVRDEFLLAATVQNLRRMAIWFRSKAMTVAAAPA